jgi:hypothetical protein
MCKWGTSVTLEVNVPADLSHKGKAYWKKVGIDKCIAPFVQMLNDNGMSTIASCCGHGKQPGNIILADEREIFIVDDYETGRKINKLFPPINP